MKNQNDSFGPSHAASYDETWAKLSPMRDGILFLASILFRDLPRDARLLCVGSGTGQELLALARVFPDWRFVAVEPSKSMLDVCRRNAEKAGIAARTEFHEGYLSSLPPTKPFDAATALLVSQFLLDKNDRQKFFEEGRSRLKPGGILVNSDLTSPETSAQYASLMDAWVGALMYTGIPKEQAEKTSSAWGKHVSVVKRGEIEAILSASGLETPTLFYQSLFIQGWFSKAPG